MVYVLGDHQFLEKCVFVVDVFCVLSAAAHQVGNLLLDYVLHLQLQRRRLRVLLFRFTFSLLDDDFRLLLLDVRN